MVKSRAVAKKQAPGAVVPDYLSKYAGQGVEDIDKDCIVIPRIKLLQSLSPEVTEGGGKSGDFFHAVAEEAMGDTVVMVPIYVTTSYLLWRPRKDGGGILARAIDGIHWDRPNQDFEVKIDGGKKVTWNTGDTVQAGGLGEFGTSDPDDQNSPPAATRMINVITVFPEHPDLSPALISLNKSSEKVGKNFCSKLAIGRAPAWGRMFEMSSFMDNNASNDKYYNFKFKSAGFIDDKSVDEYRSLYEHFKSLNFKAHDEDNMSDDKPGGPTDSDDY